MTAKDPSPEHGEPSLSIEQQIAQLAQSQREMSDQITALRDYLIRGAESGASSQKDLHRRLAVLEQSVRQTRSLVSLILESRIWKTLQTGGAVFLNFMQLMQGQRRLNRFSDRGALTGDRHQDIRLRCDTLPLEPADPVYGTIEIRGWALSPSGIAAVEISVDGGPPIPANYGGPRRDISAMFPKIISASNCGYLVSLDTRVLEDGIHRLSIRALARDGKTKDLDIPILVSQETGYNSEYSRWLEAFERPEPEFERLKISSFSFLPTVSVLVPIFRTDPGILRQTIESVLRQSYPRWELCLVDDGSASPEIDAVLEQFVRTDSRIRVAVQPKQTGISAASNRALAMATGDYAALLDHDDVLSGNALFHVVNALQDVPRPDLLYSDEDHMDDSGMRFAPFFKPDWSPDLILCENYVCHLMTFRRDLALSIGGFRPQFDLSQDHDILLRLSRVASRIHHIPRVLYHWRTSLASMSRASNAEEKVLRSSRNVVEAFLSESNISGRVDQGAYPGRWRVRYPIPTGAHVSILIPTAGNIEVLERNLNALWSKAGSTPYEVVVIDNSRGTNNPAVQNYIGKVRGQGKPVRYFDQRNESFNYSRLNNRAVSGCSSPYLLFLNDDTEGISAGWLDAMIELAARPEVGAVGAKLLYPDGSIQHAGITMGVAEICAHSFKGSRGDERHYYDFPDLIRNVSALTAACLMTRSEVFHEVGGFEEAMFPIAYNDVDLCLRIGAAGYRILYTPHALLYHYEAFSKSEAELHPHPAESLALKKRWRPVIARDPFYNPNLTRERENWSLRWE
ncbi:MAG: glycosyltransferase [Acidobacteriota bacterium]|nr:glycosyltransferase [Acidobacteriota bacterium]